MDTGLSCSVVTLKVTWLHLCRSLEWKIDELKCLQGGDAKEMLLYQELDDMCNMNPSTKGKADNVDDFESLTVDSFMSISRISKVFLVIWAIGRSLFV